MSKKRKANREQIIAEWLHLFPITQMEYERDDNNRIVVLVPHNDNWLTRTILPNPKKPAKKVHLDEVGTFVWERCDGNLSIAEICDHLHNEFGEKVNPVEERTVMFVQQMFQAKFLKVYTKEKTTTNASVE